MQIMLENSRVASLVHCMETGYQNQKLRNKTKANKSSALAEMGDYARAKYILVGPIANLKGPYFQPSLSVCLCVSHRHFYPSTLTDFDETWSQGPYSDLVWSRP